MPSRGLAEGLPGRARTGRGGAGTDTSVRFSIAIARDAALVRTVRLVAAAVARQAVPDHDLDEPTLEGSGENLVEEVRLAVGEACALLVGATGSPPEADGAAVEVRLLVSDRLRVVVRAGGAAPGPGEAAGDIEAGDIDGVEPWALLRGVIDDFDVTHDDGVTQVSMSWPL